MIQKVSYLIVLGLSVLGLSHANASGCDWREKEVLGNDLGVTDVVGQFQCYALYGNYDCRFVTEGNAPIKFRSEINAANLPPQNTPLHVQMQNTQAMEWYACDDTDSAPDYKENGIYQSFTIQNVEYSTFVADPGVIINPGSDHPGE